MNELISGSILNARLDGQGPMVLSIVAGSVTIHHDLLIPHAVFCGGL